MTRPSWQPLTADHRIEFGRLLPSDRWRVVRQAEIPSVFPPAFRERLDSAIFVSTPAPNGGVYLAFSAHRVDLKARQIDIEPFGIAVDSMGPSESGVFLHHGDWLGRTTDAPDEFWDAVEESGIGDYFYSTPPSGQAEGSIHELPIGHRGAFEALIREIRSGSKFTTK